MLAFENFQVIQPSSGRSHLTAAKLSLRFYPKGEELQVFCSGERALSVTLNSKSFMFTLSQSGDYEVMIGFGRIKKPETSLRVGIGGKFQSLAADESINPVRFPGLEIPTMLLFLQKPFTTEKALCGIQFMGQIPGRELSIGVDDWSALDRPAFRTICERWLGVPSEY